MIPVINNTETGLNIRRLMEEHHLSTRDIQKICGLTTVTSIYKWFCGDSIPSIDNLLILADAFGCTVEDVLVIHRK